MKPETATKFDVEKIRADFPILQRKFHGNQLAFLDNGASSQKPIQVIDCISHYYKHLNTNIHRGVYQLSQEATDAFEKGRAAVQRFINAKHAHEVIFTSGTTDGINLLSQTFGRKFIKKGDEILITHMEHHSNIVSWQLLCEASGAVLKVVPINEDGELIMEEFDKLLSEKTKLVAMVHVSNALGTINPVEEIIEKAHALDIPVLLDGAQAVPHQVVDVQDLDVDFYVFSGHKLFGPTGTGVLYGKEKYLEKMPPWKGGGDMILTVSFEGTEYAGLPHKFEAGTPNIAGVVGLEAAISYVESIGLNKISAYEQELLEYGTKRLLEIDGLRIIGTAKNKASLISFDVKGAHPHDIGQFLDAEGIAVRTGHHCAQPVMKRFKVAATTRASFAFYNTKEEIDRLHDGLIKTLSFLR